MPMHALSIHNLMRGLLVVVCMAIAGCNQAVSPEVPRVEPSASVLATAPYRGPPTIPTPAVSTGVIAGRIVSATTGSPLASYALYLGEILPLEPGPEYLVTLQVETSPRTTTDSQGYFAMGDIEPGIYPLIIWTPFKSLVIPDTSGEKELQVLITAEKITDVGELQVSWP